MSVTRCEKPEGMPKTGVRGAEEIFSFNLFFLYFLPLGIGGDNTGVWPSGKASPFGGDMRRFESCHPSVRAMQKGLQFNAEALFALQAET